MAGERRSEVQKMIPGWYDDSHMTSVIQAIVAKAGGRALGNQYLLSQKQAEWRVAVIDNPIDLRTDAPENAPGIDYYLDTAVMTRTSVTKRDVGRDVFDECKTPDNFLLEDNNAKLKILGYANLGKAPASADLNAHQDGGSHWVTCEIQIERNANVFNVKAFLHDSLGKAKLTPAQFKKLQAAIKTGVEHIVGAGIIFKFENGDSSIKSKQQDGSSCGPITLDIIDHRIRDESIPITYSAGAPELRAQQFAMIQGAPVDKAGAKKGNNAEAEIAVPASGKWEKHALNMAFKKIIELSEFKKNIVKADDKTEVTLNGKDKITVQEKGGSVTFSTEDTSDETLRCLVDLTVKTLREAGCTDDFIKNRVTISGTQDEIAKLEKFRDIALSPPISSEAGKSAESTERRGFTRH